MLLLTLFVRTPSLATAETTKVGCDKLTAAPSTDKAGYTLTATASSDGREITGYRFDFGDHQTYAFAFAAAGPKLNRNQVTVMHSYASQGIYTATVYVETKHNSDAAIVTSPDCHTVIADGPTRLLNTGSGDTPMLFAAAFAIGLLASEAWLKYFRSHQRA